MYFAKNCKKTITTKNIFKNEYIKTALPFYILTQVMCMDHMGTTHHIAQHYLRRTEDSSQ